jgi:hypothetical protein
VKWQQLYQQSKPVSVQPPEWAATLSAAMSFQTRIRNWQHIWHKGGTSMNDFVMSVVNEVLSNKGTDNTVKDSLENETMILERPNYQRQNSKKRLMVYDIPKVQEQRDNTGTSQLSELCKKTMEARENEKPFSAIPVTTPAVSTATGTGNDFMYFTVGNNNRLKRLVGFPYSNKEAACMGMQESCYIKQLFAVDEILRKFPALDFSVKWSVEQNEPFVFQAIGTTDMMKTVEELLNQSCIEQREMQIVDQPTPYLKKILNISADAIGTIEGVHYAKLVPKAVSYLNQNPESMVECHLLGRYLIFCGQLLEVQQVLESLK